MLWIWRSFEKIASVTLFVHNTKPFQQIQAVLPILIKTCQTTLSTRSPSFLFHKNGCGASLGAPMKPRLMQRPSTCAITPFTRSQKYQWRRYVPELKADCLSQRFAMSSYFNRLFLPTFSFTAHHQRRVV
jgi:hypothetical protein